MARVPFDEAFVPSPAKSDALIAVDDALNELAKVDPRKARVVEMRYFGGLDVEETAAALELSVPAVKSRLLRVRL